MDCSDNSTSIIQCLDATSFPSFDSVGTIKWLVSRLRIFLYLSSPAEESFQFKSQVPDYHTEMFPFLVTFVFLEWLILWLKGKPLPLLGDTMVSAAMIINMECFRLIGRGIEHWAYIYIYYNFRLCDLPWDSPLMWYSTAIFLDFCIYWGHRASHVVNFIWAHHQAHHSSETHTLVNVFRLPFALDLSYNLFYLPMAFLVPPSLYLVHHQMNLMYQFWVHTEIFGKLWAPIEYVFNTPSHHRVHHGSNKLYLDKNFGQWLIIWDRMFGTYQEELEDMPNTYGLVEPIKSFNPVYLQLFYFKKMYDRWQSMDGWKNKISSVIKGPGWSPGSPWTGHTDQIPDVTSRERHTYSENPLIWSVYVFSHFFIVLFTYQAVSLFRDKLSTLAITGHFCFVVGSFALFGMFYDRNPLAPKLEFFRCAFVVIYSQSGIALLTDSLNWSGLTHRFGANLQISLHLVLYSYFFLSALGWGIVSMLSVYDAYHRKLSLKIKSI